LTKIQALDVYVSVSYLKTARELFTSLLQESPGVLLQPASFKTRWHPLTWPSLVLKLNFPWTLYWSRRTHEL